MFYFARGKGTTREEQTVFLNSLQQLGRLFNRMLAADNIILFERNLSYRRDPNFITALADNATDEQERSLELRLNTMAWAGVHALNVQGDFVECGVYKGFSSAF